MPFGNDCEYADFDACVAANGDKDDPDAYCAQLMQETEGHCEEKSMPAMTVSRSSSAAERKAAAERRIKAAGEADAPGQRSQRSAPAGVGQSRSLAFPAELRAKKVEHNGQERFHVEGHASVTGTPYEMWDMSGPYEEIIDRGAFDATLAANPDVAFLVNHRGVTMARTTNDTLKLSMDDVGLLTEAWLNPKRQDVSDLVVAIEDRDITEMSFAFMLEEGWWSDDFETFKITKVNLDRGDTSAVNYGANPYTNIAARSREILADLDHLPAGAARAALDRLQSRDDIKAEPVGEVGSTGNSTGPHLHVDRADSTEEKRGRSIAQLEAELAELED
jgi:hypothetical protein